MAFGLTQVLYTTLTRLTLVFNETLDVDAAANIDPANYVISGDVQVLGNFAISGSSVSFDIRLAEEGKIYDITVSNLESSQGNVITSDRRSFFLGIGVVTPFLVNEIASLGALYIVSDPALVGPIIPTSNPSFEFGAGRGVSVVRSYNSLKGEIPTGGFYKLGTVTVPFRTREVHFLFVAKAANLDLGLYVNDVFTGTSKSNFEGWAGFSVILPPGEVSLRLSISNTAVPFDAPLVNTKFMTWQAAIADTMNTIDRGIMQIKDSRSIERVASDDIESNYGQFVKTPRVDNYSLDVYRELLIEVIQSFRYYSATIEGMTNVMAAFTQVRPVPKWFRRDAARWVLGWQHLMNREMTDRPRFAESQFPSTNITALSCSGSNEIGTADVLFNPLTATLQYKSVGDAYGTPVDVTGPGQYTLTSDNGVDSIVVQVGSPTPALSVTIPVDITGLSNPSFVIPVNATYRFVNTAYFNTSGLAPEFTATAATPSVQMKADPTTFEHLGETFVASFWVLQQAGAGRNMVVEISEDGGSTWDTGPTVAVPDDGEYHRVAYTRSIGYFGVTDIRVRLRGLNFVAGDTFVVERPALHSPQTGALYLGHNTRPRSRRRKFFGYELLQFLREPLEIQAFNTLGIQPSLGWGVDPWSTSPYGSPSYGYLRPLYESSRSTAQIGLMRYIVPTHVELDVFQDSVLANDNSGVINVRGVVYESDWRAGVTQNFTVVPRQPDRFSHLIPSTPSRRTEVVEFNGSGEAALEQVSLQDAGTSRLTRNGVPIPNSLWEYTDSTHIQLLDLAELDGTATYELTYDVVISFASGDIDLGANFELFNWYADWYEYNRVDLLPVNQPQLEAIQFSPNSLLGKLTERANTDTADATLYRNNGRSTTPVSTNSWRFIDPGTVKIDADAFDPTVNYSIEYTAQSLVKAPVATSVVEVQYSADGVTYSSWVEIPHDAPFGNRFRYWRFRISVFGVKDTRDFKLRSLVLKGDPLDRSTIRDLV
jgi:hypothetical protein